MIRENEVFEARGQQWRAIGDEDDGAVWAVLLTNREVDRVIYLNEVSRVIGRLYALRADGRAVRVTVPV